jgi:hypothetical protein
MAGELKMLKTFKENISGIGLGLVILCALYLGFAGTVFQWRNPKANQAAFWLHIGSALRFERLPQFQE